MLIKKPSDIRSSEITDRKLYFDRRAFLRTATGAVAAGAGILAGADKLAAAGVPAPHGRKLDNVKPSKLSVDIEREKPNTWDQITTYNNYYEFGTDKEAPSMLASRLKTEPWTVVVEGECNKKGTYTFDDILKGMTLEDRIYRHRCVEAWSMIIPWVGFSLSEFVKRCEPTSKAKFMEFYTLYDSSQMPGVRMPVLRWPYIEGLRMDEAMHPLTILAVGLYGEVMPKQDGAPIRIVVPWKYGFKSAKSIVRIRFVEKQPVNSWQDQAANEYGFYSNVNPTVDHPRWSQATERRIGEFLKRRTLMFNGYADQVQGMYAGMDLKKNY
ncbi:MAG: protein-methionine-sulfoxide reductase catalytic subunit MsrP [Acidobacteria bacterium]|nr:MAG: protein-methionine-sulfoxide reductase catalytic subunit MsrP [Acidobacteriota bacterium]